MKKSLLALAIIGAFSSATMAQSVTVYGDIDTAMRSTTNAGANGGRQISLGSGIFENSLIGFKGVEDLGGGSVALFDLEAGFNPSNGTQGNDGAQSNQNQLFGNQAWVGLRDGTLGEIDAGRQYGLAYQTLGSYSPLGRGVARAQGNASELAWQTGLYGVRFDNSLDTRIISARSRRNCSIPLVALPVQPASALQMHSRLCMKKGRSASAA